MYPPLRRGRKQRWYLLPVGLSRGSGPGEPGILESTAHWWTRRCCVTIKLVKMSRAKEPHYKRWLPPTLLLLIHPELELTSKCNPSLLWTNTDLKEFSSLCFWQLEWPGCLRCFLCVSGPIYFGERWTAEFLCRQTSNSERRKSPWGTILPMMNGRVLRFKVKSRLMQDSCAQHTLTNKNRDYKDMYESHTLQLSPSNPAPSFLCDESNHWRGGGWVGLGGCAVSLQ